MKYCILIMNSKDFLEQPLYLIQSVCVYGLEWLMGSNDYGQVGSHLEMDESILMTLAVLIFV